MMITPSPEDPDVIQFAASIVTPPLLSLVPIAPGPPSLSCSANVREMVDQYGGALRKGWRLWILPGKILEAEAHSVWETPIGRLADMTPTGDEDPVSLFLEDSEMRESPGDDFIPSKRFNLCGLEIVDEFIRVKGVADRWNDQQNHGLIYVANVPEQARAIELLGQIRELNLETEAETQTEERD